MQGTSFLVAWITSEARTELTEKASSLEHTGTRLRTAQNPPPAPVPHPPQIQNQARDHARLGGLPLGDVVEEELTVGDHGEDPLPALLHAAGLRDLAQDPDLSDHANAALLA